MLRNLLFDLDGTLTDPREGIVACIRHALVGLGREVPPERDLVTFIGPPLRPAFEAMLGSRELADRAVALYRERFATLGMFENEVYPGVAETLATLRDLGFTLLVATSKPTTFAVRILEHFELAGHFAGVHGSELSGERSDKGELLAHLLHARNLSPRDAIMIGDRSFDMLAARKHGIGAIGVLWGYGSRDELLDAGAEVLVTRMDELVAHLRSAA